MEEVHLVFNSYKTDNNFSSFFLSREMLILFILNILIMSETKIQSSSSSYNILLDYIKADRIFERMYELYKPNEDLIARLTEKLPKAKVITISTRWCPDCKRNVPRLGKIAESLPNWEFIVYSRDEDVIPEYSDVKIIPTFIVLNSDGKELARVVENPKYSSLEEDLLKIATGEY